MILTHITRHLSLPKHSRMVLAGPTRHSLRSLSSRAPPRADVVVAGGGIVGSCAAYFLKLRRPEPSFKVVVLERDPAYTSASTVLSVGGIRHQFSVPGNVELSLFSSKFIKELPQEEKELLQFYEEGYLILAGSEKGADSLRANHEVQAALGAESVLLDPKALKNRFPWMETSDILLSSLGTSGEGWLDPWSLLKLMREKAASLGAVFVKGNVAALHMDRNKVASVICSEPELEISCGSFVNACGAWSSQIHSMYDVQGIPVSPKKRTVFVLSLTEDSATLLQEAGATPLTVDPSGVYFRRDGRLGSRTVLCGVSPDENEDEDYPFVSCRKDFERLKEDVDYDVFENIIWPALAKRSTIFEQVKVKGAWSGLYDYNTFDQNGIVGKHPNTDNVFIATGFSGHGFQQGPAVGRALSELILAQRYETINLAEFSFDRVISKTKLLENNIY